MKTFFGTTKIAVDSRHPVATVGVFDGVHLGHQKLISELIQWARETKGKSVIVTFDRHPQNVLRGQLPSMITSLRHRLLLFDRMGVDFCVVLKFDMALAQMSALDFVRRILHDCIGAKGLLIGFDSSIGKGGQGTFDFLRRHQSETGLEVRMVEAALVNGEAVSSTAIRDAIVVGELKRAEQMLGRRYSLLGTVARGAGVGIKLGFPTANLDLHHELRPPEGVYAALALVDGSPYPSLVSIGTRPTFKSDTRIADGSVIVEAHIVNWQGDLYGRDIEVEFVARLRDQAVFANAEELVKQMQLDREIALKILSEAAKDKKDQQRE